MNTLQANNNFARHTTKVMSAFSRSSQSRVLFEMFAYCMQPVQCFVLEFSLCWHVAWTAKMSLFYNMILTICFGPLSTSVVVFIFLYDNELVLWINCLFHLIHYVFMLKLFRLKMSVLRTSTQGHQPKAPYIWQQHIWFLLTQPDKMKRGSYTHTYKQWKNLVLANRAHL